MKISFSKYHGLGNDFLLMDDSKGEMLAALKADNNIQKLCHRNEGIGADGILLRHPSNTADHQMLLFNADGTQAEISGNGLRCFILFLREKKYDVSGEITVETGAGIRTAKLLNGNTVESSMPSPDFASSKDGAPDLHFVSVEDQNFTIMPVNVGNPHGVIFGEERDIEFAKRYGPSLEKHPLFPRGANIEFVHVLSKTACQLVVWERGAGITLACGSGSVATACAGAALGHFTFDSPIKIKQPGGTLEITVGGQFRHIQQRGPAKFIFKADIDI